MFNRTHAQASPSVTLEKGISRLRPVRAHEPLRRPNGKGAQARTILPTEADRKAATLLACVALAVLFAVCLMLYLLNRSSRWEVSPLSFSTRSELRASPSVLHDRFITPLPVSRVPSHNADVVVSISQDLSERFMSYLPHSGFHNQRIALENALVISHILNRTLLVPPVILGDPPLRYRSFAKLRIDIAMTSKLGLEHCALVPEASSIPDECMDFWTHPHVPWEWFIGLRNVTQQHCIKVLIRQDLTDAFLVRLGLDYSDAYFLADRDAYQFRFFDSPSDEKPLGSRYKTRIDLSTLATLAQGHRLLQFGTLFGTTRVRLSDPAYLVIREHVRRAMVFSNPELLAIADEVRDSPELGGDCSYAAVHLRLGDGVFADADAVVQNVRSVWWRLVRELGMNDEDALKIESSVQSGGNMLASPPDRVRDAAALRVPHPSPPSINYSSHCQQGAPHPMLAIPLYIATDKPNHRAISILSHTFPCVYFLSDFGKQVAKMDGFSIFPTGEDAAGRGSRTSHEELSLAPYLPPFLDAIIASKARIFVGTHGSTFSRFVEDVLWRAYHGWDIVQRG